MTDAPYILALDVALNTGVAEGRAGEAPRCYSVSFEAGGDMVKRVAKATLWIAHYLKERRPDIIAIEAPLTPNASRSAESTIVALTLFGAIAGPAEGKFHNVLLGNVQTVRAKFLGHGRPDWPKERARAMCRLLGWEVTDLDQADAAALFWHAGYRNAVKNHGAPWTPVTPMMQAKVATEVDAAMAAKAGARKGRARA